MDVNKYLIIIKNEDKTEDIISYENNKNLINIKYKSSEKMYSYSRRDFQFYKNPTEINTENQKVILNQGYVYNVIKILKFESICKLFFEDGTSIVIPEYSLQLVKKNDEQKTLSANKFDYYKEISKVVSVKTEEGKSLLTDEYEGVNFISSDTALYKYLNPKTGIKKMKVDLTNIIFPFGANKSQFQAVKNAMNSQISIIEGPPGTGKTQTILNIIANIIKNGQTVAVVSNNNAATDNVYEKLQKYHLDYLCARLGKKENKEEFINNQTGRYPIFEDPLENEYSIQKEILELNQSITKTFDIQNNIAKLKEELNDIKLQYQYFNKHHDNNIDTYKIRSVKRITSEIVMKLKVEYEELQKINLWFRIKSQFLYGIGKKDFYKREREDIINCYNRLFFVVKEMELKNEIKDNNKRLNELGNNKLNILIDDSIKILNEYLRKKYSQKVAREIYDIKELYNNSRQFNEDYPIVFSTTYSIKKCLNRNYMFDYIIMDESSQVDLITGVLALSVARNAVIVGDLKQLPNVITTDNRNAIEEISKRYKIPSNYDYLQHSFLSSISDTVTDAPKQLLQEHYRCHPKIIQFCNKKFYDGNLIIMTEDKGEDNVLEAYISTKGNHARGHKNIRQIDIIEKEIIPKLTKEIAIKDIGVISPYREQKKELESRFGTELKVDTIHKFQGREEEAIILTTVDNEIGEFVDDPKMLNVAVTRAKRFLRVVVSDSENNVGTNIDDLIKYIQYNNFEVVESKTKSIYDMLYKENRKQRMEYLKNKKRISDYDSENLTYNLIEEVIKENNFDNLDIVVHIPLMDILANEDLLNEEEKLYANNDWTHIDFVIFNKMDKKMVLAIEVDGYYYHKEGTKQQERDKVKDRILEKYEVPLIRLSTAGSGEKKVLEEKIREIFAG